MQDYRKLRVWQRSHKLVLKVRNSTDRFPRSGFGSLKLQLTRAVESIPFNLVEGCGAASRKDFARFLDISIKSSTETEYQLQLARDYSVLNETDWTSLTDETVVIRKMLYRLRKQILDADDNESRRLG